MIPLDVAGSCAGDGFLLAWQPGEHLHRSAAQWDRRCRIRDPVLKNSFSQVTHFKYWAILEISLLRMRFKDLVQVRGCSHFFFALLMSWTRLSNFCLLRFFLIGTLPEANHLWLMKSTNWPEVADRDETNNFEHCFPLSPLQSPIADIELHSLSQVSRFGRCQSHSFVICIGTSILLDTKILSIFSLIFVYKISRVKIFHEYFLFCGDCQRRWNHDMTTAVQ